MSQRRRAGSCNDRAGTTDQAHHVPPALLFASCMLLLLPLLTGCAGKTTQLHESRAYPYTADLLNPVDVMVYRDGPKVQLVNHTVQSYRDFTLWINERYVDTIKQLNAGESITLQLEDFTDQYGEPFRAGGLLSTRKPEPLTKAEIETEDGLIGLLVVPLDH